MASTNLRIAASLTPRSIRTYTTKKQPKRRKSLHCSKWDWICMYCRSITLTNLVILLELDIEEVCAPLGFLKCKQKSTKSNEKCYEYPQ